jgi:hypothetical protein
MSLLSWRTSSGDPVMHPSEQKGELTEGPKAFAQLWLRNKVRPQVIVPGIGARTLPFGFDVGSVVHTHQPLGIGPLLFIGSHPGLFLQCIPPPLLPEATFMETPSSAGFWGTHQSQPIET